MSDAEMADGIIRGTVAFDVFWNRYWRRVYAWVRTMVGNVEDARDLTNCVFVQAWQRLGRYSAGRSSLSTWLYLLTRTVTCAYLRKHRPQCVSLDEVADRPGPACEEPEELHAAAAERERIWRAVEQLPKPESGILLAYYRDGLTWKEVARRSGLSLRAVMYHVARGLELLGGIL